MRVCIVELVDESEPVKRGKAFQLGDGPPILALITSFVS